MDEGVIELKCIFENLSKNFGNLCNLSKKDLITMIPNFYLLPSLLKASITNLSAISYKTRSRRLFFIIAPKSLAIFVRYC